jgi:hypothetical protein
MKVHDAMMEPAQPHQVRDLGLAAKTVLDDVVGIEGSGVMTAGELTARVSPRQPTPLPPGWRPSSVELDRTGHGVGNDGDRPITTETLGNRDRDRRPILEAGAVSIDMDNDLRTQPTTTTTVTVAVAVTVTVAADEIYERVGRRLGPWHTAHRNRGLLHRGDHLHRPISRQPDGDRHRTITIGVPPQLALGQLLGCLNTADSPHRPNQPANMSRRAVQGDIDHS